MYVLHLKNLIPSLLNIYLVKLKFRLVIITKKVLKLHTR